LYRIFIHSLTTTYNSRLDTRPVTVVTWYYSPSRLEWECSYNVSSNRNYLSLVALHQNN